MAHIIHIFPEIDKAIHDAAGPAAVRKLKRRNGAPRGEQPNNVRVPREIILAIRAAHEIDRLTRRQVEMRFPLLRAKYIHDVLEYKIRANTR